MSLDKGEDRISKLPEDVLNQIISYLTTKEAMRTSVLSKYWESKWTNNCNVVIDDSEFLNGENSSKLRHKNDGESFCKFLKKALHVSQNVKKFRLSCEKSHDFGRMASVMPTTVFSCKIESIEISCLQKGFILSSNFFNHASSKINKDPSHCILPKLTTLFLDEVSIRNEYSNSDRVQFSFPLLKILSLIYCKWLSVKSVEFYVPSLTNFTIRTGYLFKPCEDSIKVFGARLSEFVAKGGFLNIDLSESQVTSAKLQDYFLSTNYLSFRSLGLEVRHLLRGFSTSVEKLEISTGKLMAIARSKLKLPLIGLHKLEHLVVQKRRCKSIADIQHF